MATDTKSIILYGGGIILVYYILKSWGIIATPCDPSICTAQCPKGPTYTRGLFADCDPGYLACGWFQENCCCLNAPKYAYVPTTRLNWKPLTNNELRKIQTA